jgi:peptidyl-prolyl cis-trans isomerase C
MKFQTVAGTLAMAAGVALAPYAGAQPQLPTKEPAKPAAREAPKADAAKPRAGPVATVNGIAVPRSREEVVIRERVAQGSPDTEQLRAAVREDLINREVIAQEATRAGMTKDPQLQAEIDLVRQTVLVQHYVRDWVRKNPVLEADVQKEYDRAKAQTGENEYKARHILVETEEQAKALIEDLRKGAKFEELARKNSQDPGSRDRGGDLDWNIPGVFDKQFSDAMVKLEKGRYTEAPVRTSFGFHVIQLDDVRAVRFPSLAEVKPRIEQQLVQDKIEGLVKSLRAKAKVE